MHPSDSTHTSSSSSSRQRGASHPNEEEHHNESGAEDDRTSPQHEEHPPRFLRHQQQQEQPQQQPQRQQHNEEEPRNRADHNEFYHDELPLKKKARITTATNIYHENDEQAHFYSNGDHELHQEYHYDDNQRQPHYHHQQQGLQHQELPPHDDDDDDEQKHDRKPPPKQQPQPQARRPKTQHQLPAAAAVSNGKNNHRATLNHNNNIRPQDEGRMEQPLLSSPLPSSISTSPSDRIVLDVGGTEIVTSLRTLTSNSSYFASVFSNTWRLPPPDQRPFLDQDPEVFKILLNFMRSGYMEEHQLTKPLLLQAAYLGMDRLLQAVMILAYRNSNPNLTGSDQDAMQAFGREYGDIVQATCQGHLPALLFRSSQEPPKEYASLYFHKAKVPIPHMVAPQYRTGIRTSVLQTPECASLTNSNNLMLEWSDAGGYFLPVFALNYLGKRGFTLADSDLQGFWDPRRLDDESEEIALGLDSPRQLGRLLGEVLFVRYQEQSSNTSNEYYDDDSVTNVILTSRPKKRWTAEPKEYATVNYVKCVDGCVFIQAAGGVPRRVPRLAGEYLRDTGRLMCKSIALAMDWLQQHGFTHNEPQLEALLTRIGNEAKDDYYGPTMVFSRPLNENEPLLPCRLVNVDFAEETSHLRGHAARHG